MTSGSPVSIDPTRAVGGALSSAEVVSLAIVAAPAATVIFAYGADRLGFSFLPWPMLALALGSSALAFRSFRRPNPTGDLLSWAIVVVATATWLVWLASPSLMPLATGPDLTHHLLLIDYLERHWRLVHDPTLATYMGEMAQYTPGSQLLAALVGAWSLTDGLRALHVMLSLTVALKVGFVFLIARRVLPPDTPRLPLALMAVVLAAAAPEYAVGSFTSFGFVAQVVAELFTVALWWIAVAWSARPDARLAAMFSVCASAAFLTWPIDTGPPALAFALLVLLRTDLTRSTRFRHLVSAFALVALVAVAYAVSRLGWLQLAGTAGFVPWPTVSRYSTPLVVLSSLGFVYALVRMRARATALFVFAIALQTAALYVLARRSGADRPYMALKMFYLLLWPMTVCAALAVGELWSLVRQKLRVGLSPDRHRLEAGVAWLLVAGVAVGVARPLVRSPRLLHPLPPAVSAPLYEAGRWARENLPSGCIEYLVGDDETAYWLHLAVLGNPRMTPRGGDNSTYEPRDALVRWLTPDGLPYAIADVPSLPRDVAGELDIIQRFGTAAVARRRGPFSCTETP